VQCHARILTSAWRFRDGRLTEALAVLPTRPFVRSGRCETNEHRSTGIVHLRIDVFGGREAAAVPGCDPYDAEDPFANNSGRRIVCHAQPRRFPSSLAGGWTTKARRSCQQRRNPQDCDFERRCYTVTITNSSGSVTSNQAMPTVNAASGGGAGGDTGGSCALFNGRNLYLDSA
jgi:hypothetical protein